MISNDNYRRCSKCAHQFPNKVEGFQCEVYPMEVITDMSQAEKCNYFILHIIFTLFEDISEQKPGFPKI
jgi:hypothetical protein